MRAENTIEEVAKSLQNYRRRPKKSQEAEYFIQNDTPPESPSNEYLNALQKTEGKKLWGKKHQSYSIIVVVLMLFSMFRYSA